MRRLLFLMTMFFAGLTAFAQADFSIKDFKIKKGETKKLPITMTVTSNIQAFQLDLYVPDGVTFDVNSTSLTAWGSQHSVSKAKRKDGSLRVMVMTFSFGMFNPGEDEILTVDITAAEDIELGTKNFQLKNIAVTTEDESTQKISLIDCPVKIYDEYTLSAASSNETMGAATLTQSGAVENGTSVTATATPIAGYEFVNWTVGEEVKSTESTYVFNAAEDLALTANFKPRKFDVTFDVDGNETTNSLDFASAITAPADPTKIGYTFIGWSPAFVEGATVPVNGITYKATWTINQYTITFDTDGGSEIAAITQDYATDVTAPADPTKTGYTFKGWDKAIPATIPAENVAIKAQWQINQYTITFDTDGGSEVAAITQNYATDVAAPANPTKTGYTFKGWDKEIPTTIPAENVTIKATWQINQYTISFDTDGGSEVAAITQNYATDVAAPANPTKTGYTFKGWDKEVPATIPAENVTIKAQWQINQYTITFDTDGGSEIAAITQDYATDVTAPVNPTKTGYTFKGWDKEVPATIPAENVTIKAQWQINQYTITFDTDGGSEVAAITQNYATDVAAPANPTKTGYTFKGWDKEVPATIPAENVTIKAQWQINQYTITFDTDGGSEVAAITQDYASAVTAPAAPTKTGYTFKGWDKEIPATIPAENVTIKAQWQINQYTITFDTDGGSEIAAITQDYATDVTAPADPTKTGYTFKGWDKAIPATIPAENVAIKAQWQINQYTVKFVSDEQTLKTETLDYNSVITAPEDPSKIGYTFKGWSPAYEEGATVPAEDFTYTAVWDVNKYTITFDTDGGSEVAAITQDFASAVTAPADPTKTGYTFKAWDKEIPATIPAENVTIKATWTINQYTVKFVSGEETLKSETLDYNSAITAPEDPSKIGYTFKGWSPAYEEGATVPAEDVTYTAVWDVNKYTITFDTDGGSEVAAITQDYASAVTAPADPTKTGYTFKGWDKAIPATIPAENVTIKATWTINQYTVKFVSGEETLKSETLDYNSAIAAPADPTKTGYTFKGWSPAYEEGATVPAEDFTYTAVWDVNKYTITFDTDGGSEVAAITQDFASAVTAPADPTKTGYTFKGWDKAIPATIPAENVTIKATWTINQYTVKFVSDETVVSEQSLDYGAAITAPEAPAKEGYTFKGWSPDVDETVPAKDVTYVAEYTVNTYKLTYVLDGKEIKTIEVEYGSEIEEFVPEVETGRVFDGWTDEIPETMPAKDLTINGKTSIDTFIRAHFAVSNESVEVYTINGTHVMTLNKADDINRLTRGTYIINGRKVVIRK